MLHSSRVHKLMKNVLLSKIKSVQLEGLIFLFFGPVLGQILQLGEGFDKDLFYQDHLGGSPWYQGERRTERKRD